MHFDLVLEMFQFQIRESKNKHFFITVVYPELQNLVQ